MAGISSERAAQIGIAVQLLALIRTLAEYFRLKHFGARTMTLEIAEPYITGSLIAAVCMAASVGFYFLRRYKVAVAIAAGTVVVLLVYKLVLLR